MLNQIKYVQFSYKFRRFSIILLEIVKTHNLASSGKNVYDDFINIVFLDLNLCIKGILKSWNIERAPSKGIF
jgi:hypothetical protein